MNGVIGLLAAARCLLFRAAASFSFVLAQSNRIGYNKTGKNHQRAQGFKKTFCAFHKFAVFSQTK